MNEDREKKDYITTYSKRHVTPLDPDPEDISVRDIAHALSLMVRANGHFPEFYSVGQHCIHCALEAQAEGMPDRLVLACLLHDAGEAYLADITRPVKQHLPKYRETEQKLLDAVYRRFLEARLRLRRKKRSKGWMIRCSIMNFCIIWEKRCRRNRRSFGAVRSLRRGRLPMWRGNICGCLSHSPEKDLRKRPAGGRMEDNRK